MHSPGKSVKASSSAVVQNGPDSGRRIRLSARRRRDCVPPIISLPMTAPTPSRPRPPSPASSASRRRSGSTRNLQRISIKRNGLEVAGNDDVACERLSRFARGDFRHEPRHDMLSLLAASVFSVKSDSPLLFKSPSSPSLPGRRCGRNSRNCTEPFLCRCL